MSYLSALAEGHTIQARLRGDVIAMRTARMPLEPTLYIIPSEEEGKYAFAIEGGKCRTLKNTEVSVSALIQLGLKGNAAKVLADEFQKLLKPATKQVIYAESTNTVEGSGKSKPRRKTAARKKPTPSRKVGGKKR